MNNNVEKIIKLNYRFSETVKHRISKEKNTVKRLNLIEYYLYFCTNNFTGFYSNAQIENYLLEYSKKIDYVRTRKPQKDTALIVMTEAFHIGGHTPISSNWINNDKNRVYSLVITNGHTKKTMPDFLIKSVEKSGGTIYYLDENKSRIEQARDLLEIAQQFEHVFLNIHMFDVVPVIAFGHKNWDTPIYFYHHANFLFTVGMSITDRMFCLCEFDKRKALEYRGINDVVVLPFPPKADFDNKQITIVSEDEKAELKYKYAEKYGFDLDNKIILSMGAEFKYSKVGNMDFCAFAESVVNKCNGKAEFLIIGPDANNKRWKDLETNTQGLAKAIGLQNRDVVNELMKIADCYVTCFPMNAFGANDAFRYGKTIFRFSPTGRFNETAIENSNYDDLNSMESSLIDVVLDKKVIIHKNVSYTIDILNYNSWDEALNEALTVRKHKINRNFSPQRAVEIEELINVQLLRNENYPFYLSKKKDPFLWLKSQIYYRKKQKIYKIIDKEQNI